MFMTTDVVMNINNNIFKQSNNWYQVLKIKDKLVNTFDENIRQERNNIFRWIGKLKLQFGKAITTAQKI